MKPVSLKKNKKKIAQSQSVGNKYKRHEEISQIKMFNLNL